MFSSEHLQSWLVCTCGWWRNPRQTTKLGSESQGWILNRHRLEYRQEGEPLVSWGSFKFSSLNLNESFILSSSAALAALQALGGCVGPAAGGLGGETEELPGEQEAPPAVLTQERQAQVQVPAPPLTDCGLRGSSQDAEGTSSS